MSSSSFYDGFLPNQVTSGINERIYELFKRTCSYNLSGDSSVLEIGCGIGTLTYLLKKKIKSGVIEAIDFSGKSIEYAKQHLKEDNIVFTAADILEYHPGKQSFDFILLFDVIEHIPLEKHPDLFKKLSSLLHEDSYLLINIPNPDYVVFDQQFHPERLQEIDQPVQTARLLQILDQCGLEVQQLETYSIWVKNDYRFFAVKKKQPFKETFLNSNRSFSEKLVGFLKRKWNRFSNPYPKK